MNAMTFEKDGDYIVAKINGKEVARTKLATLGITEQELDEKLTNYQLKLTAGDNITIEQVGDDLVIKATDTGTVVVANPTLTGTEDLLTGLQVGVTAVKADSLTSFVYYPSNGGSVGSSATSLTITDAITQIF